MLTIYKHAHNLRKCSQLTKMLTTCKNAHTDDLQKCSQLKKENVQLAKMLQQLVKMLTTCKNAHNRESVLQLAKMLTSFKKIRNTCTQVFRANGHDFPWLRRAVPLCYIFCTTRGAGPQNRDVVYLFNSIECWDSIPKHVQMIMVYIRQSPTPTFS